jgi:hypothetical protein
VAAFCFLLGTRIGEADNPGPSDRMRSAAKLLITDKLAKDQQGKTFEQAFKDKTFVPKVLRRLAPGASENMQALYHFSKAKQSKQKLDAFISEPGQAAGSENANTTGDADTGECTRSRTCTDLAIIPPATEATPVRRARRSSPQRAAPTTSMLDNILPYVVLPTFVAAFGLPTKTQKAVPFPCCGRYCSSAPMWCNLRHRG